MSLPEEPLERQELPAEALAGILRDTLQLAATAGGMTPMEIQVVIEELLDELAGQERSQLRLWRRE